MSLFTRPTPVAFVSKHVNTDLLDTRSFEQASLQWRYILFLAMFACELCLVLGHESSILKTLMPDQVPYQHVRGLHQLFVFLSLALSRVIPVVFPEPMIIDEKDPRSYVPFLNRLQQSLQVLDIESMYPFLDISLFQASTQLWTSHFFQSTSTTKSRVPRSQRGCFFRTRCRFCRSEPAIPAAAATATTKTTRATAYLPKTGTPTRCLRRTLPRDGSPRARATRPRRASTSTTVGCSRLARTRTGETRRSYAESESHKGIDRVC